MEKSNNTGFENKIVVWAKGEENFIIIYWVAITIAAMFFSYKEGKEEFDKCVLVKGRVIDQIHLPQPTRTGATYVWRPQITFPVGDTSYVFTDDHTVFNNGEIVDVLYLKDSPRDAKVYTLGFWIDLGIIVPFFLIGIAVFGIIWIKFTNYGKKPVILKGECD